MGSDPQQEPRPTVTCWLIATNVVVFAALSACGLRLLGSPAEDYLRFGVNFAPLTTDAQWWRLLTASFVHLGVIHLALNSWALWESGRVAEKLYGHSAFAAIYVVAAACGSVASMLWRADAINAGAAGAIFGLFGALLASSRNPKVLPAAAFDGRLRLSIAAFVVYSVFFGFKQAGIDNAAHVGGLGAGLVLGAIMPAAAEHAPNVRAARRRTVAAALAACALIAAALWMLPGTPVAYREAMRLQKEFDWFAAEDMRLERAYVDIIARGKREKSTDAAVGAELTSRVVPQWQSALARLSDVRIDRRAPSREDYEVLIEYASARHEFVTAVARFLATGDGDEERIRSLRERMDERRRAFQELQRRR